MDWSCKYCKKKFVNERAYMKHECTQLLRSREIQTLIGQMAYSIYKVWMEKQRRTAPAIEVFMTSAYYSAFIKFAEWVKSIGIVDPAKYVELMIKQKIYPNLWRRNEAYQIYLDYMDKRSKPTDQAAVTVETIIALSEGFECPPGEVFQHFQLHDMLDLINQRRLSPWLLFCSKKFKEWYGKLDDADRSTLMKSIGIEFWANKMDQHPEVVSQMKQVAEDLGI